jgi:hypothetical protein
MPSLVSPVFWEGQGWGFQACTHEILRAHPPHYHDTAAPSCREITYKMVQIGQKAAVLNGRCSLSRQARVRGVAKILRSP